MRLNRDKNKEINGRNIRKKYLHRVSLTIMVISNIRVVKI
jgi:hypothetical protein